MNAGEHAAPRKLGRAQRLLSLLLWVGAAVLLTWFVLSYVVQAFAVPSGSMESTVMTGDRLYAEKVSYLFRDPAPGDVITFKDPDIPGRILLKRCIATGGQTVDINDQDGLVYVDGEALEEPYTRGRPSYRLQSDVVYPYEVPAGSIWVMGDNRTDSQDSRYFGAVPVESVTARGLLVYWPLEDFSLL